MHCSAADKCELVYKKIEHFMVVAVFRSCVLYKKCNINSKLAFSHYTVTEYHLSRTASPRGL